MLWKDEYSTGVESIDEQHKTIFRITEDFREALQEGGGQRTYDIVLESLEVYCQGHFKFEEACMTEHRCPVAAENEDAHVKFRDVLEGFRTRYQAAGYDRPEAYRLMDTIDQWLAEHICRIDVHLRNCVKK